MADVYGAVEGFQLHYVNRLRLQAALPLLRGGQGRADAIVARDAETFIAPARFAWRRRHWIARALNVAAITAVTALAFSGVVYLAMLAEAIQ